MDDVFIMITIALLVVIVILVALRAKRETLMNIDDIIIQYDRVRKNRGTIFDFRSAIQDPSFSAYKYAQLTTLYDQNILSQENARNVLIPPY